MRLVGFGTFSVRERAAGKGRNPATGKEIKIAASKNARFKPGAALKASLNKKAGQEVTAIGRVAARAGRPDGRSACDWASLCGRPLQCSGRRRYGLARRGASGSLRQRDIKTRAAQEGRLAQLAEHLVYTERVGGSSPSPPTSRLRACDARLGAALVRVALRLALSLLGRGAGARPAHDVSRRAARGARLRRALSARDRRRWRHRGRTRPRHSSISSSRSRDAETARASCSSIRRGGNVVASMVFGHSLRELRVAGIVGALRDGGDRRPVSRANACPPASTR